MIAGGAVIAIVQKAFWDIQVEYQWKNLNKIAEKKREILFYIWKIVKKKLHCYFYD